MSQGKTELLPVTASVSHRLLQGDKKPGDRWQQVKLQRAEWTRPHTVFALFGRVLYVSNLPQVRQTGSACDIVPIM